jgi:hypothetical protein
MFTPSPATGARMSYLPLTSRYTQLAALDDRTRALFVFAISLIDIET